MNGLQDNNGFVEVNGWKVYFEKFGSGPNVILLIPGPIGMPKNKIKYVDNSNLVFFKIGTGRTDFEEMLDGDDELDWDKFTVVAVEAPGWGRSRPPLRKYDENVYTNDCECFHAVMQVCSQWELGQYQGKQNKDSA